MLLFASADDVERFAGMANPPGVNVEKLLRRASGMVQHAVRFARFEVAPSGLPSDPDVMDAMRDATCAQVDYWIVNDIDPTDAGTTAVVSKTSLDGASLDYDVAGARAAHETAANIMCTESHMILANAGLIGGAVWVR